MDAAGTFTAEAKVFPRFWLYRDLSPLYEGQVCVYVCVWGGHIGWDVNFTREALKTDFGQNVSCY